MPHTPYLPRNELTFTTSQQGEGAIVLPAAPQHTILSPFGEVYDCRSFPPPAQTSTIEDCGTLFPKRLELLYCDAAGMGAGVGTCEGYGSPKIPCHRQQKGCIRDADTDTHTTRVEGGGEARGRSWKGKKRPGCLLVSALFMGGAKMVYLVGERE